MLDVFLNPCLARGVQSTLRVAILLRGRARSLEVGRRGRAGVVPQRSAKVVRTHAVVFCLGYFIVIVFLRLCLVHSGNYWDDGDRCERTWSIIGENSC